MEIRAFDFSDADYQAITDIHNAVYPTRPRVVQNALDEDAQRNPKYLFGRYLAIVDGKPVAEAWYEQPHWSYREGKFMLRVQVMPDYQRQGIGKAVYDTLTTKLNELGGTYLFTYILETHPRGIQFAEKNGYQFAMRYPMSHLDPHKFDVSSFAGHLERFETAGYTVRTLTQLKETDTDWARKLHHLVNTIADDIPSPDEHVWSPFDEWLERLNKYRTLIPDAYFVALDGDQYVGLSFLLKNLATPEKLEQGLTGTIHAYRRKGIATVLKVHGLEWVKSQQGYSLIETDNEENNPMYQINVQLGFEAQPAAVEYVKKPE